MDEDEIEAFRARVAEHIGSELTVDGKMPCPKCGGDFGPNRTIADLMLGYDEGYLPGSPGLVGVCLDCGHITHPKAAETGD